ncbi:MAG: hypothetical protein RIT04_288 [Candidatus Parcubacteria bacterium]|jgi:hypothetical protein
MHYSTTKTNIVKYLAVAAFVAIAGFSLFSPAKAQAGFDPVQLIDPFCLWSGCGDEPTKVVKKTIINSNVNSPGGVVTGNTAVTGGHTTTGTPVVVTTTPVYTYNYPSTSYTSPLNATCYASPTSVYVGGTSVWSVSAYGGNGAYYYSWSGTDGLSGNGRSIYMTYNNTGTKNATVTVTSGNQTISINCNASVIVYDNGNNYNYNNGYNYNYNSNYYNNGYYNTPLTVSCVANTSFAPVGRLVQWTATASGGYNTNSYAGNYSYRWTGTDGINGSGQTLGVNYGGPGTKYASVTVYMGGQSVTQNCSGSVTVGIENNQNYNNYNNGNLEIACFADADRVRIGTPVTWGVEATGGNGSNYAYSWTGSEGLSGSQRSAVTTYSTAGIKNATVTVTSGGVSASKLCGNAVTVVTAPRANTTTTNGNQNTNATSSDNSSLTGSAFFSLSNVPWGWVAILTILVLLAMVVYLIVTRNEPVIKA